MGVARNPFPTGGCERLRIHIQNHIYGVQSIGVKSSPGRGLSDMDITHTTASGYILLSFLSVLSNQRSKLSE